MLADPDTHPKTLPPGFSFVEGEPVFDPSRHLALEPPQELMTLEEFGYSAQEAAQFASPIVATSPVRVLSNEGIAAVHEVLARLKSHVVTHGEGEVASGQQRIYFGEYRSRFIRDLIACEEVVGFLSDIFQTPIAPHTMGHLGCQINFGNEKVGGQIAGWHHDIVGFTTVLSMHDPSRLDGGHFVYFKGRRDEGQALLDNGKALPEERLVVADTIPMGHAAIMQGSAVLHAAQPMRRAGYRCNIVTGYVSRNVTAPDPNRPYVVGDFYHPPSVNPIYTEMARHAAWLGRAKLGGILEAAPWTEDRDHLISQLRAAVEDVERCIDQLRAGDLSAEQYDTAYRQEDRRQMSASPFDPESNPED